MHTVQIHIPGSDLVLPFATEQIRVRRRVQKHSVDRFQ